MDQIQHAVPISGERCRHCGFEFSGDVRACIADAAQFPGDLAQVLGSVDSATVRHRRVPHEWSLLEFGAHIGDVIPWYLNRIQQVLQEDRPQLYPADWAEAAELGEYRRRSVQRVCDDATRACADLIDLVTRLEPDQLTREGIGSDGSARTVEVLISRADHELVHHRHDLHYALDQLQNA